MDGSVLRRAAFGHPVTVGRLLGAARTAIGVAALAAPRAAVRRGLSAPGPSGEAVVAVRLAGGRDLALGLGTLAACGGPAPSLAGWLAAGALVDVIDAAAHATAAPLRPGVRVGTPLVATAAAVMGLAAARRAAAPGLPTVRRRRGARSARRSGRRRRGGGSSASA